MGRGPRGVRRGPRADLDAGRPGGRHGRQLGGLGADHARAPRTSTCPRPRSSARSSTASSSATGPRERRDRWCRRGRPTDRRRPSGRPGVLGPSRGDRRGARGDRPDATSSRSSCRPTRSPTASRHPDVYLEAARRLGVDPAACLVVEDSYNGVRAGAGGRDDRRPRPEPERAARPRDGGAGGPRPRSPVRARSATVERRAMPATGRRGATTRPVAASRPPRNAIGCPGRPSARFGGRSATGSRDSSPRSSRAATCGSAWSAASGCRRVRPSIASTT